MKRDEAQQLLQVAHDELGGLPHGHQTHVLNVYAELYGFEDGQMKLTEPHSREAVSHGTEEPTPVAASTASLEAAPRRSSQRGRILETMCIVPAGVDWLAEEISDQTGFPLNSVSTRMSELVTGGWVRDSEVKRPTKHGELATTYVPTMKALRHYRAEAEAALQAA